MLIGKRRDRQENRRRKPGEQHQQRQQPAAFRAHAFHHGRMGRRRQAAGGGKTHHGPAEEIAHRPARKGEHGKAGREEYRTGRQHRRRAVAHQHSSKQWAAQGADGHHDREAGENHAVGDGQFLTDPWPEDGQHIETATPAHDLPDRKHADKARARRQGGSVGHGEIAGCEVQERFW